MVDVGTPTKVRAKAKTTKPYLSPTLTSLPFEGRAGANLAILPCFGVQMNERLLGRTTAKQRQSEAALPEAGQKYVSACG